MQRQAVENWLADYGSAWVAGDPEKVLTLFTKAATYAETPFADVMRGHTAIRQYWQEGAADAQSDVTFTAQVWAVEDHTAIAGWQATFTRKKDGSRVALDGVFRLTFEEGENGLLCASLQEWWHRNDI